MGNFVNATPNSRHICPDRAEEEFSVWRIVGFTAVTAGIGAAITFISYGIYK